VPWCVPCSAYPAVTNPLRTLQCVPGSAYPAATNPQRTLQCPGAYPAVIQPLGAYPAVRTRQRPTISVPCSHQTSVRTLQSKTTMLPAVPARVRVRAVRTLQCPGAYPVVTKPWPGLGLERCVPGSPHSPLRTLQCQACSLKTGFPASTPRPRSRRPFSQAKSHIRQAIHGFLGPLVGCARAAESWVRTLQQTDTTWTEKKSPPPRRRQHPPPPRPSPPPLGTPPFGGRGARRPPAERKRGGYPSSPGTFADAQTRRPPPPAPLVPPIARIPRDPADSPLGSSSSESPGGKSRRRRAYPQQIVTTRLLYCLQDPFAQLSRLQRI